MISVSVVCLQQPEESFGMNVAGGIGCQVGDIPVYISAIRPESAVARCGKIQVRGKGEEGKKGGRRRTVVDSCVHVSAFSDVASTASFPVE